MEFTRLAGFLPQISTRKRPIAILLIAYLRSNVCATLRCMAAPAIAYARLLADEFCTEPSITPQSLLPKIVAVENHRDNSRVTDGRQRLLRFACTSLSTLRFLTRGRLTRYRPTITPIRHFYDARIC